MGVGGSRRRRLRRDDEPPAGAARAARRECSLLVAVGRGRGDGCRRHRQGALPHRRRSSRRGGPHALPRRAEIRLRLLTVRMSAHMHVLRDWPDAVRPEPERLGDPRPGAPLQAHRAGEPPRVHGHGRAVPELRGGARSRAPAARDRDHPSADHHLDRRLDARSHALCRRGRGADPARALHPRRRSSAPVAS